MTYTDHILDFFQYFFFGSGVFAWIFYLKGFINAWSDDVKVKKSKRGVPRFSDDPNDYPPPPKKGSILWVSHRGRPRK